ncbi:class I SAM-dependent DNA methyltransferase [Kitasatospora viridis]|uniref:Methyltransferase family protein n=1 Tax=Kitasatospora viridis TaxID=281105 RepID=A0A561SDF9_9ACTN|nr:class I SAM-dependent methyltransferase [Kitasatospora viridis]TWF72913.1 methyltransferase family protein [Kitasatospora viridis]
MSVDAATPPPTTPASDRRADSYAARFAARYDDWFGHAAPTADTVALLAELAGAGPVLELGPGTGRVALPLAARGLEVHGVDGSPEMAAELRSRPGGERIALTIGDFTDLPPGVRYSLVYLAGGTFFELPTQEAQLRCFAAVAARLAPGGSFVFDALLPETLCAPQSAAGQVLPTADGSLVVRHRRVDRAEQRYESHYLIADGPDLNHVHVRFRYAGSGELDLMARLAGLRLHRRYGSWAGTPFQDGCAYHVPVYRHA